MTEKKRSMKKKYDVFGAKVYSFKNSYFELNNKLSVI